MLIAGNEKREGGRGGRSGGGGGGGGGGEGGGFVGGGGGYRHSDSTSHFSEGDLGWDGGSKVKLWLGWILSSSTS